MRVQNLASYEDRDPDRQNPFLVAGPRSESNFLELQILHATRLQCLGFQTYYKLKQPPRFAPQTGPVLSGTARRR